MNTLWGHGGRTKRKISMARMSDNEKSPSTDFGDSLQLTNWVLDSGATCHIIPQVSDFIPGLLEDTDKNVVATVASLFFQGDL